MSTANKYFLKGRNSILTQLPCPHVFMYKDHACVSITDLLDHRLSDGTTLEFLRDHAGKRNSNGLNGTPAAQKLLNEMISDNENNTENCAFGYIILWSDSFLRCFIRQKQNSIWVLVIRICPPSTKSDKSNTYCLAMSRSFNWHDKVIRMYLEEIETVRKGRMRYYTPVRTFINTFFDLLLYVADTPERNKLLAFLDGGNYGFRSL